jgi:hypothetical protein
MMAVLILPFGVWNDTSWRQKGWFSFVSYECSLGHSRKKKVITMRSMRQSLQEVAGLVVGSHSIFGEITKFLIGIVLYTIVITYASLLPTPLECSYEVLLDSSWVNVVPKLL